jgi:hypothetical protein
MYYPQQTILIDGASAIEPLGVEVNECTIPNKQSLLMGALQLNHHVLAQWVQHLARLGYDCCVGLS